ncbi:MAG: GNAT family N-acetyltransferase [Luteimonas sp.]
MSFVGPLEPISLIDRFIACPPRGFSAGRLADGTPAFVAPLDLLSTAELALRTRIQRLPLYRHWRRWLTLRTRFIGTTVSEYAWLPGDVDPVALASNLRASQARRYPLLVIKDIPCASPLLGADANTWAASFAEACAAQGFVLLEGQALAWLPIDFGSTDEFLSRLSRGRRRDIRRKLRARADLQVDCMATGDARLDDTTLAQMYALYLEVFAQSEIKFDLLERDFFDAVLCDAASSGVLFTYRVNCQLIGWNLCFEYEGALVDKYIGLRYPEARTHNLYTVSWMENLNHALRRGLARYVAGWTDPEVKAQLGARFTFTRHAVYVRNPLLRMLLRRIVGRFEGDRAWHDARADDAAAGS